jgi:hypothetical protein
MGRAWLAALCLLGACYNPQIADGTLKCSALSECPSGFKCNPADGHCYQHGGGPSDSVDSGGGTEAGVCTAAPGLYGPFAGCNAQIQKTCDPVCQAGCGCNERCMADKGVLLCKAVSAPFKGLTDQCDSDADTCRPGLICLVEDAEDPARAACGAHCYRHCRNDNDCQSISPYSKCSIEVAFQNSTFTAKTCTQAPEACSPWGAARCARPGERPLPTFACYVLGTAPDQTTCECAGQVMAGAKCIYEHDCVAGYECVADSGMHVCKKVCALGATTVLTGGCPVGATCTPFSGSTKWGYCK